MTTAAGNSIGRQGTTGHSGGVAGSLVLIGIIAALMGASIGLGNPLIVILLVTLFAAAIFIFYPTLLFWAVLLSALVLVGLIRLYLPQLQAFRWLVAIGAIAVPLLLGLQLLFQKQALRPRVPPYAVWAFAFFLYSTLVALAMSRGFANAVLGLKDYFQAWGLMLAFMLIAYNAGFQKTLFWMFLAIGVIQVPFALHQYFFLVPLRFGVPGTMPADIVVGTFGGDMGGGGNNAALAAYQFFCIAIVLSLWKIRQLPLGRTVALTIYLALPIFLNETKVSFFFAILAFLVVFMDEIRRHPFRFIQAGVLLAGLLAVFVSFYLFVAEQHERVHNLGQYIDHLIEHNLFRGYGTFQLNRLTALTFWFAEHVPRDPLHALVGHGLTQTREASAFVDIGATLAGKRYAGMGIGLTALSGLLWEVGVIGVALVIALFASAFRLAGKLAKRVADVPLRYALLKGVQAALAVVALSLAHKPLFMFELVYQAFVMLLLGYLAYEFRIFRSAEAANQMGLS